MGGNLILEDGSKIAVIGGGPAGSYFSYFAMEFARRMGTELNIDIYEAKNFNIEGPAGCNNCGGIISESLVQALATEGIVLPSKVVRRGIETYTLHMDNGTAVINTPVHEQRIASVFRGFGPKGTHDHQQTSFDNHLLGLCEKKGVRIIPGRVIGLNRNGEKITVGCKDAPGDDYDLVVGAAGLNAKTLQLFGTLNPDFVIPGTTKTHICEINMEPGLIDEYFGNSMHVFLLNLPRIKFGALIPKGHYVTLVLLGDDINKEITDGFLNAKQVKDCFPPGFDLRQAITCQCYPNINVKAAKFAYADRMVLIGDSASSKLFKNGIGAAYITGKAAARTVIFNGISRMDFQKNYKPVCDELNFDNLIGKAIFTMTSVIQKSNFLKKGIYLTILSEQKNENAKKRLSSVLWDTFTGSAPYKDILKRSLHPMFSILLIFNSLVGLTKSNKQVK